MSMVDQLGYSLFDLFKSSGQRQWNRLRIIDGSKELVEDTGIELGEEQSYLAAIGGELIAVGTGNAPNDAFLAQAS